MKSKTSATHYVDNLIFAKLDYMLALAKLMVAEIKYRNSLYAKRNNLSYPKK